MLKKITKKSLGLLGSDMAYNLPDDKRNGKPFERGERDVPMTRTFDEFENFGLLLYRQIGPQIMKPSYVSLPILANKLIVTS